ncbi:MAG: DUF2877 domain-containing protein [Thermodesulfobacteriota bacterium]
MRTSQSIDTVSLEAESIGEKALKVLGKKGGRLEIHSVFDHAVYIAAGKNRLVKLIRNKDFLSPYSILIKQDGAAPMSSFGFEKRARVSYLGGCLASGDGPLRVDLSRAHIYRKEKLRESLAGVESAALNLRILRDVIYTHPGREGLVPLLENVELRGPMKLFLEPLGGGVAETARPHIERLMWGLYAGDPAAVADNAGAILGLGPGLTPSCDDFLAGLFLSLGFAGKSFYGNGDGRARFFKKAGDEMLKMAEKKTTVYSVCLIGDARRGEGPRAATDLIKSLLTGSPEETAASAKILLGMGATTGADIAVGIYYGVRFLNSLREAEALYETA